MLLSFGKEIFKELASLQEIGFAHKEDGMLIHEASLAASRDSPLPDDFAASAAMALHRYPANEVLRGPFALDEWRSDVVAEYLSTLTPTNCLIMVTSDGFREESTAQSASDQGWKPEEWYKAYYKLEPLDKDHLDQWREKLEVALQGQPSGFIPNDFSLRASDGTGAEMTKLPMEVLPPNPLIDSGMLRLWHKVDKAFKTPREYVLAHVHTAAYDAGPEVVTMMRLFCSVVSDDLNTFSYDASVAGLGYNLEFAEPWHADNLTMSIGGFNDKLPDLLKVVVERIATLLEEIETIAEAVKGASSEEELLAALGDRGQEREELLEKLEVQRQILLQDYKNFTREDPWSVGSYYLSQLMLRKSWHLSEYIEVLERGPDLAATAAAVRTAFRHVQVDMLVHGNATAEEAKSVADTVCASLKRLGAEPLKELRKKEITQLPLNSTTVFEYDLAALNPAQENCSTQVVYQVGPTNEDLSRDACVSLACRIAHVSAFQRLRTELQLGYIVQAFPWVNEHICGFSVLVQGPREHPQKVDELIETWLEDFGQELEEPWEGAMSDEDFQNNVEALVNERTQRYSRLLQEATRHWAEILPRRYQFERILESTEALKSVKKEDVAAFFQEYLAKGAPSRRKLSSMTFQRSLLGVADLFEKALKPSWMSLKFSPDHVTASMEFSQAATQFRAANMLQESADAWAKSGEMKEWEGDFDSQEQLHDLFGAGRAYESAGGICDGSGPDGAAAAMRHWQKAVQCFRVAGKADVAAKLLLKLAGIKEKQGDIEAAKSAFQDALGLYEDEEKDYELGDVYKTYIGFLIRSGALEDALVAMDGHIGVPLVFGVSAQAHPGDLTEHSDAQTPVPRSGLAGTSAFQELLSKIVLLGQLEDTVRADEILNASQVDGWFTSRECQVGCDLVEALKNHDAEALAGLQTLGTRYGLLQQRAAGASITIFSVKEQTFTFLQVEVARVVRQLKVAAIAPREDARPGSSPQEAVDPADLLM
eukprot:s1796_g13.t1